MVDPIADIVIPVAAILVPTAIAIALARAERLASKREREERARARRDAAHRHGIELALASMSDLVDAAYTIDAAEEARLRIRAASRFGAIRLDLAEHSPIVSWVVAEMGVVSVGLDDRTPPPDARLPRHGEQIVWRAAHFVDALTDWALGNRTERWFAEDDPVPIAETVKPSGPQEQKGDRDPDSDDSAGSYRA